MEEIFFDDNQDEKQEILQEDEPHVDPPPVEATSHASVDDNIPPGHATTETTWVGENVQLLLTEISQLRQDFDTKVKYDDSKERLITNLHKELQFYREGLHFRVLKPLFIDLISLYNDMDTLIHSLQQELTADTPHVRHLALFQSTIEEILHRNGADLFRNEQETFVPSKQRALRTVATSDPEKDKWIARRVRPGFEYEGKLLQPELVEIYKYTPEN